jgi:hypothetical protein
LPIFRRWRHEIENANDNQPQIGGTIVRLRTNAGRMDYAAFHLLMELVTNPEFLAALRIPGYCGP